jgi:hypothetical protein
VKLIRNIAFVFIVTQDAVGAELNDLLGRKVKAIIVIETRTARKRVRSDHNDRSGPVV